MTAIKAGGAYFTSVFAVGFVLGCLRVLLLEPQLGALTAVLVETPFILAACWFLSRHWVRKFKVDASAASRLLMGGVAFLLLMGAEFALGRYGFGRTFSEQLIDLSAPPGAIGLAGQILFGLFPLVQTGATRR